MAGYQRSAQVRQQTYIHGNTAVIPQRVPERRAPQKPQTKNDYVIRRNQEKALQIDLPYLIALVIAACCALCLCVNYLHIQSSIAARMDNIKTLELKVEALKSENDALETRISTSIDLDHVYTVATEELGMVYANKDQVLLYNKTESEYIRQNEDIPKY